MSGDDACMHTLSRIFKQAKYGRRNLALIDDLNASLRALQIADKARRERSLDILRSDAYGSRTEYDPANIKMSSSLDILHNTR